MFMNIVLVAITTITLLLANSFVNTIFSGIEYKIIIKTELQRLFLILRRKMKLLCFLLSE